MRKPLIIPFFVLLFSLLACSENELPVIQDFNQPDSKVKVFSALEASHISKDIDNNIITFKSNTPDDVIPVTGTIIKIPAAPHSPYGFLGKVTNVKKSNEITVTTSEIPLTDAYPRLSIDADMNILKDIEGVFDEEGNAIKYSVGGGNALKISLPYEVFGEDIGTQGTVSVSFTKAKFSIDNKDGLKYLDLQLEPKIALDATLTVIDDSLRKSIASKKLFFKSKITADPLILPITIPIYFNANIQGELDSEIHLNYAKSFKANITYKNKQWTKACVRTDNNEENPWNINMLNLNGSLDATMDIEFDLGLFDNKSALGFQWTHEATLTANAPLVMENPFIVNPEVNSTMKMTARSYGKSNIFDSKQSTFDSQFPSMTCFEQHIPMFPAITQFKILGGAASAEANYQTNSNFFITPEEVKTGIAIFKDGDSVMTKTVFPDSYRTDKAGNRYYDANITDLSRDTKYQAAPIIAWKDTLWHGEKQEFSTETNYSVAYRCVNFDRDIITFNFNMNHKTGNFIDYTVEGFDYYDSPMRIHFTATYNEKDKTMEGEFDFFFYDFPAQQRKDGFKLSMANDDSGYTECTKIINNGGCFSAIRIYKTKSAAARLRYNTPLTDDDCKIGIFNKNYEK